MTSKLKLESPDQGICDRYWNYMTIALQVSYIQNYNLSKKVAKIIKKLIIL